MLGEANALLQTVENASWAVGPIARRRAHGRARGRDAAYWINAVSFLVSAVLVARIPARLLQSATALTRGHWTDLKDGFARCLDVAPAARRAARVGHRGARQRRDQRQRGVPREEHAARRRLRLRPALRRRSAPGLVVGSFWSSAIVERIGIARAYGGALARHGARLRRSARRAPNIWVAAACCVVGGIGDGVAVVCNALLVQRGARDEMRGRALTFVMSATLRRARASASCSPAPLMPADGARWVWVAARRSLRGRRVVVGYALAREPAGQPAPLERVCQLECRGGRAPRLDT